MTGKRRGDRRIGEGLQKKKRFVDWASPPEPQFSDNRSSELNQNQRASRAGEKSPSAIKAESLWGRRREKLLALFNVFKPNEATEGQCIFHRRGPPVPTIAETDAAKKKRRKQKKKNVR